MLDFSFWEISVALLVALVCIGPKRLPEVAAALGRWVGRMRSYARFFRQEIQDQMRDYDEVGEKLRESHHSIKKSLDQPQLSSSEPKDTDKIPKL